MNYINVLITGLFGVIVAILTWKLAGKREKRKFQKDVLLKRYYEIEAFYVDVIATIDKVIRITRSGKDYSDIINEISIQTAKINLMGCKPVNEKLKIVDEKIQTWSSEYRKGIPKRIEGTTLALSSNLDQVHFDKANELYPEVNTAISELNFAMQVHLFELRKDIEKSNS